MSEDQGGQTPHCAQPDGKRVADVQTFERVTVTSHKRIYHMGCGGEFQFTGETHRLAVSLSLHLCHKCRAHTFVVGRPYPRISYEDRNR